MEFRKALTADKAYPILFAIALIALAFRITPLRFDNLLLGGDPWYHYSVSEKILETGSYPVWDYNIYYPAGTWLAPLIGFYHLPVYLYKFTAIAGMSFFKTFQITPAIFGALICIPLYFLIAELYNKRVALLSAMLFAISPWGAERSLAGFYRGDVFFLFFILLIFLFYIWTVNRDLRFSILAGITLFITGLFWSGWVLGFGILTIGVILSYFREGSFGRHAVAYAVTSGIGLTLIYVYKLHFHSYTGYMPWLANEILYVFGGFFMALIILTALHVMPRKNIGRAVLLLALAAVILLSYFPFEGRYAPFGYGVKYFSGDEAFIAEKMGITLRVLLGHNILLLLLPLGFYLFMKRMSMLLLAYIVITFFLQLQQVRFIFLAAPAMSFLGALALDHLMRRPFAISIGKLRQPGFLAVILLVSFNTSSAVTHSYKAEPFLTGDMYESMLWIKQNTPQDASIYAWWDYTGPIVGIADRKTVLLTVPYRGRLDDLARLLAANSEASALDIVMKYKVDYILIDDRTLLLWDRILSYVDEEADFYDSMLYKMYMKTVSEDFRLAYENSRVRLYQPYYNYTKISTFEVDKYHYAPGEELKVSLVFRSNEIKEGRIVVKGFGAQSNYSVREGEPVSITLEVPPVRGRSGIRAMLYDEEMKKLYDSRGHEIAVTDELVRKDTALLKKRLKSKLRGE
jgi:hypothetical protein